MSSSTKEILRHALILVFEYERTSNAVDVPNPLLSMETDLKLAYELSRNRFGILPQNITVVTDLKPKKGVLSAWDPLSSDPLKNPRIVRLLHPDITRICREIAQFIENTVRGIREITVTKGEECIHEIFIYLSGHGAQIPNPIEEDERDNALIFTTVDGMNRRYLRDEDIFRIFFGHIDIDDSGYMTIPVYTRDVCRSPKDGSLYYNFTDDTISFQVTPSEGKSERKDRGLPSRAKLLVMIDSCHSGTMTDFQYMYKNGTMIETSRLPSPRRTYPMCICLSAANDDQEAPSTSAGSPFTRHMYNIFNSLRGTVSIHEIYNLMYRSLPGLLRKCGPTITATTSSASTLLPLLATPGIVVSSPKATPSRIYRVLPKSPPVKKSPELKK